jgi:hypothetical protein
MLLVFSHHQNRAHHEFDEYYRHHPTSWRHSLQLLTLNLLGGVSTTDPKTTWQSDRDVPHRQWQDEGLCDTPSWSFVIHELAPLPDAPQIDFSDDEVADADVEFEPLPFWIASAAVVVAVVVDAVVGHDEDAIEILDCFIRRHAKSMNRMTALMMMRRKRLCSFCCLLFCSSVFYKSPPRLRRERPQATGEHNFFWGLFLITSHRLAGYTASYLQRYNFVGYFGPMFVLIL